MLAKLVVALKTIINKLKVTLSERTENLPFNPGSEVPERMDDYAYFGLLPVLIETTRNRSGVGLV